MCRTAISLCKAKYFFEMKNVGKDALDFTVYLLVTSKTSGFIQLCSNYLCWV